MKRIAKWTLVFFTSLTAFVYLVLAGFLWWSEQRVVENSINENAVVARSLREHNVTLINDGLSSLSKRIELIEGARDTIELEYFIYELDLASRIITQKLIEAAARGVRIRLLVDFAAPVFKLGPAYVELLKGKNIEVKYYNTVGALRFISAQHRSHRKFLIVDGNFAVTGGRNIGNDYFNLSKHYNFLDSDILIQGPIVNSIKKSFDTYWESDFSSNPEINQSDEIRILAQKFIEIDSEVSKAFEEIKTNAVLLDQSNFKSICHDIAFISDSPGVQLENRQVYRHIEKFLDQATSEVVGESPYFVLRSDGMNLLDQISKKGIQQTYLTNSLRSTDAFYTVSAMIAAINDLQNAGVKVQLYNGQKPENLNQLSIGTSERWGIHSKRAVVDKKHILIGTYNVDPRSANLNSEVLIICRNNPELATHMIKSIQSRIAHSWPLFDVASPITNLTKDATLSQKTLFVLALPLANLFDFLL